jgi:hypothetical protein
MKFNQKTGASQLGDEAAEGAQEPPKDGPIPPNLFWYNNQRHEMPPRLWSLAKALWGKDMVKVQDVAVQVWEDEGLTVPDKTIRATLSKLNARLNDIGIKWTYHLKTPPHQNLWANSGSGNAGGMDQRPMVLSFVTSLC